MRYFLLSYFFIFYTRFVWADTAEPRNNLTHYSGFEFSSLFQMTMALVFVLGTILVFAYLFRRFTNFQSISTDSVRILGGLSLGSRERIVILKVGSEQILLGITPQKIEKLHVLKDVVSDDSCLPQNNHQTFAQRLSDTIRQKMK